MVRIACCQIEPTIGDLSANAELIEAQIRAAVEAGAHVIVLPELATSGYMFADADEARATALTPADFANWSAAVGNSIAIGGFCEKGDDGKLYNSAVMVDADGVVARYRKTHLWDREKLIFTPGDTLPPVVNTKHGVIAVMVCYDIEFGELTRRVTLDGAELIAAPVNWPLFPRPEGEHPGEVITAMSTARTNKIAVACCDRAGVERNQRWTEGTTIIDPNGWIVASPGPGSGMAIADIAASTFTEPPGGEPQIRDQGLECLLAVFRWTPQHRRRVRRHHHLGIEVQVDNLVGHRNMQCLSAVLSQPKVVAHQ
jgi:predicted amidohydrolase